VETFQYGAEITETVTTARRLTVLLETNDE